jgi:hypothetical protein
LQRFFVPEAIVKKVELLLSQLFFIAVTRGILGAGIGLLVAGRLSRRQRRRVGTTLAIVGALTTIPAAFLVRRGARPALLKIA